MKFVPPVLTVLSQSQCGTSVDTVVVGDISTYRPPLAPAGLYDVENQRDEALQLHKIVLSDGETYTFRTYEAEARPESICGKSFVFRPWWTPKSIALVTKPSSQWRYALYPADGTHAHCELTYVGIGANEDAKDGYFIEDLWVTCDAYERYIRDDVFHCRDDA
jgi:hypothetical protein